MREPVLSDAAMIALVLAACDRRGPHSRLTICTKFARVEGLISLSSGMRSGLISRYETGVFRSDPNTLLRAAPHTEAS